ncbi:MAG: DUF6427 family protein [Psychroserpens sp.]|uniref:DUF6427 family protein n=1 Tax=Psychroserpens sp. TaxID=2020870 RepID=UPI003C8EA1C7
MISTFFSKSKPIHYIVVSTILLVVFVWARLNLIREDFHVWGVIEEMALFSICLFSVFLFDFFVSRNKLTKKNSYNIVLFVLFFAILPETVLSAKILMANVFVLLSLRRLISLRTQKNIKKKLFDAAFWVVIATLFYAWSAVFIILVFVALVTYAITDVKNYLIPFIGVATAGVLVASYVSVTNLETSKLISSVFDYSLDYSALNSKQIIVGSTILLSFGLWSLFYYVKNIKSQKKTYRPSFKLIIMAAILGLLIVIFAPTKNGSEFLFLFAPLSIIITNYIEVITEKWFKETLLLALIVAPVAMLLL